MSIDFGYKKVAGFDKELLYNQVGYLAKPVTLDKSTLTVTPTEKGRYIIPQGTLLYGQGSSLLLNPNQNAKAVVPTLSKATIVLGETVKITSKADGTVTYKVTLEAGTARRPSITASATEATIKLGVDKAGAVTTTYNDVISLINTDMVANNYIVATLVDGKDGDAVASAGNVTTASGSVTTVDSDIDGVLLHSVDVTDGEATGAMMIGGNINIDNMPVTPDAAVIAKLPNINFLRRD